MPVGFRDSHGFLDILANAMFTALKSIKPTRWYQSIQQTEAMRSGPVSTEVLTKSGGDFTTFLLAYAFVIKWSGYFMPASYKVQKCSM
jgi:hypothetical protein